MGQMKSTFDSVEINRAVANARVLLDYYSSSKSLEYFSLLR